MQDMINISGSPPPDTSRGRLYSPEQVAQVLASACEPWMQTSLSVDELAAHKAKRGKTTRRLRYRVYDFSFPLEGLLGHDLTTDDLKLMARRSVESPLHTRDHNGRKGPGLLQEQQPNGDWAIAAWRIVERQQPVRRRRAVADYTKRVGAWDLFTDTDKPQRSVVRQERQPVYVLQVVYVDQAVQHERDPLYDRTRETTSPMYPYATGESDVPPPVLAEQYELGEEIVNQWVKVLQSRSAADAE